jgi:pyruvate dehydrogenase E1 component
MSIYQARFQPLPESARFLTGTSRSLVFHRRRRNGRTGIAGLHHAASRENLDNLVWVVNCNLQRLDGPVRGNGKIIQELEAVFRGAGWNVIKVIWGSDWDPLLDADKSGLLLKRMEEASTAITRNTRRAGQLHRRHFFGKYPELLALVNHLTDDQIRKLLRGGHDPMKVYAAYKAAVEHKGQPTVILAKTIKGYGLGEAGEGRNITHQQKKLNEKELREFRSRFDIPISDEEIAETPFYRRRCRQPGNQVPARAPEKSWAASCRKRRVKAEPLVPARVERLRRTSQRLRPGSMSTTMGFVRLEQAADAHKEIGKRIVPIIPDEARTFGMDAPCSARSAFIRPKASSTSRWTASPCFTTTKPRTGRSSRKASPKPVPWPRSSPPAPPTPTGRRTWFRSTFTIRCSASSASAI